MKLLTALILALALGVGLGGLFQTAGDYILRTKYMSPAATQRRVTDHLASLRRYVAENELSSTNFRALNQWCRERRNCQIIVYNKNTILTADENGGSLVTYSGFEQNTYPGHSYAVNFSDGPREVSITDHAERRLYLLLNGTSVLLACVVFLTVMLLYNRQITNQIRSLSRLVRQVSRGDLALEIGRKSKDEIGDLAGDVDAMRLSIIDKLRREERAWQANSQLITAISHDVRTPLTTLMGYLDILSENPDLPAENRQNYLGICRRKAENLRELTDELFAYFLVLGAPEPDAKLDTFDADTLLTQLLGEFAAELRQRQFTVEESLPETGLSVRVDIQHLQRIFYNLSSNICKYAAPEVPVSVQVQTVGDLLHISVANGVKQDAGKVESTKIGLQTCEKLALAMGGEFRRRQEAGVFTAELFLPAAKPVPAEEAISAPQLS